MFHQSQIPDQDQGFEQQKIIIKNHQQNQKLCKLKLDGAINIMVEQRPKDFIPRTIFPHAIHEYPIDLDNIKDFESEIIKTEKVNKIKCKKFASLFKKYQFSQRVYNKFETCSQKDYFNSYLNLNGILDYNPKMFSTYTKLDLQKNCQFDSKFQSGNLLYVYKINSTEYDLILQNDVNTKGYNQWFYFSFLNFNLVNVKFNIVNLLKKKSLLAEGVRPVCFSLKKQKWENTGVNLKYYKSMVYKQNKHHYYTFSFQVNFSQKNDKTYFALTLPYTYSKMNRLLKQIQNTQISDINIEKKILCHSISNNPVPYLRLKSNTSTLKIVIMARQHPGQTVSSYVLQSLIRQIVKNPQILKQYQIIIFPMVNPDGVIYGNFRTSLSGFDLNRQWQNPNRLLHPEIYYLKKFLLGLKQLVFVLDIHGHSKKYNSFIYACRQQNIYLQKLFPYLMSRNYIFSLKDCTYGISPDKITTARSMINQMGINNIFTLQTSFYGYLFNNQTIKFNEQKYNELGKSILQSLEIYFLKDNQRQKAIQEIKSKISLFQYWENIQKYDSGSQSNPSQDQLNNYERQQKVISQRIIEKKKKKKYSKIKRIKKSISMLPNQQIQQKQQHKNQILQQIKQKKIIQKKSELTFYNKLKIIKQKQLLIKNNHHQVSYQQQITQNNIQQPKSFLNKKSQKYIISSNLIKQRDQGKRNQQLSTIKFSNRIIKNDINQIQFQNYIKQQRQNNLKNQKFQKILHRNGHNIEQKIRMNFYLEKSRKKQIQKKFEERAELLNTIIQRNSISQKQQQQQNDKFDKSEMNSKKRVIKLYEPKKSKILKPLQKSVSSNKDLIYLSELVRPYFVESSMNINAVNQDIEKQLMILKNEGLKRRAIFYQN